MRLQLGRSPWVNNEMEHGFLCFPSSPGLLPGGLWSVYVAHKTVISGDIPVCFFLGQGSSGLRHSFFNTQAHTGAGGENMKE